MDILIRAWGVRVGGADLSTKTRHGATDRNDWSGNVKGRRRRLGG